MLPIVTVAMVTELSTVAFIQFTVILVADLQLRIHGHFRKHDSVTEVAKVSLSFKSATFKFADSNNNLREFRPHLTYENQA